jgi:tripartite-type tricarboxylate transporter receptor subunit TctC
MRFLTLAGISLALLGSASFAQEWKPLRPIKIVVPFAPGGGADASVRLLTKGLSERLGQTVYVENRAGASGAIGSDYVYLSPPDGLILLAATSDSQSVNPHLNKTRSDAKKFVPLAGIAASNFVLMGRKDLPAEDLRGLLKLASKKSLSYSSREWISNSCRGSGIWFNCKNR